MTISVRYYDGRIAAAHTATLESSKTGYVLLSGDGFQREYAISALKIHPALGSVNPTLDLPDDGYLELLQHDLPQWLAKSKAQQQFWAQLWRWENKVSYVVLSLLLVLATVTLLVKYGVPAMAKSIAMKLPASTEHVLAQQSLEVLDHALFAPTKLSRAEQDALSQAFRRTIAEPEHVNIPLYFRSSAIGANALALPGGIIVVTDDLVNMAKDQNELLAVLAHEVGHVKQRHSLRSALSIASTSLLIAAVTGDMDSVIATIPATLAQLHYSRDFEHEADDYARQLMLKQGIPLHYFADILLRLSKEEATASKAKGETDNYLSTHPDTQERIKPFLTSSKS